MIWGGYTSLHIRQSKVAGKSPKETWKLLGKSSTKSGISSKPCLFTGECEIQFLQEKYRSIYGHDIFRHVQTQPVSFASAFDVGITIPDAMSGVKGGRQDIQMFGTLVHCYIHPLFVWDGCSRGRNDTVPSHPMGMPGSWNGGTSTVIEGSLEVKLPTTWTDEKQRWEESEKRREEERRSKKRKSQKKDDPGAQKGRKVAKHCVSSNDLWLRRVEK